jgi:hypothetical protein
MVVAINRGPAENLRRWTASGEARRWVEARGGAWTHDDWLRLVDALWDSWYWPLDTGELGRELERINREWGNLRRWIASGQAERWVQCRLGEWGHDDWLALARSLRRSEFWPLDLDAVGAELEACKRRYRNFVRWQTSGHGRRWVAARRGQWDDRAWAGLLDELRRSAYWPLDVGAVERALAELKAEWWNLHRWRASGLARRWVAARDGRWGHDDWLALLASLRASGFWPVDPAAVGRALEEVRTEWANLRRWEASGAPRRWVDARGGRWSRGDWNALLDALFHSDFWPLDPAAAAGLLQRLAAETRNLRAWRVAGGPRRWVTAHPDGWNHDDWLGLLTELRASAYWPLRPADVGAELEATRAALADCGTKDGGGWVRVASETTGRRAA